MSFILDCSVAMSWCFADEASPETDALLDRLRNEDAIVPALWHWEVANVLTLAVRRKRIDAAATTARLTLLGALPILTDSESVARAWRETMLIAQAEVLTAYDAAYLELAERMGVALATKDEKLRAAGRKRGVAMLI